MLLNHYKFLLMDLFPLSFGSWFTDCLISQWSLQSLDSQFNISKKRNYLQHQALFTTIKIWKQPKCPLMNKWIRKMCDICPYMEYNSAIRKKNLVFCNNTEGPWGNYAIGQTKTNTIQFHLYVESKKVNKTNTLIRRINWWLSERRGVRGLGAKEEGIKMYKLPIIKTVMAMYSTA